MLRLRLSVVKVDILFQVGEWQRGLGLFMHLPVVFVFYSQLLHRNFVLLAELFYWPTRLSYLSSLLALNVFWFDNVCPRVCNDLIFVFISNPYSGDYVFISNFEGQIFDVSKSISPK